MADVLMYGRRRKERTHSNCCGLRGQDAASWCNQAAFTRGRGPKSSTHSPPRHDGAERDVRTVRLLLSWALQREACLPRFRGWIIPA
jgi:hypothetical protein